MLAPLLPGKSCAVMQDTMIIYPDCALLSRFKVSVLHECSICTAALQEAP